jgi:glycine betaine/proline transport system substrate-binding protein
MLTLSVGTSVAADLPGAGKTIQPARATWTNEWFGTEIYIKALQDLGYDVKRPVTLEAPTFYQAVGQGDVDFWVNGWFPLHDTYRKAFGDNAEVIGYMVKGGALQGYLIDKKTADAHHIVSLEDFKKPEIAKLFDITGDGKADMVGCPPGWGCELVIENHMDAYGLRDAINVTKASYEASMADVLGRYKTGKPVFFYAATPSWAVGVMKPGIDVVWLEVPFPSLPKGDEANLDKITVPHVEGCVADPCKMGFPPNDIRVVANKKMLNENPAIRKLFEVAAIPLEDFSAQNARMNAGEDKDSDIIRQAAEWIAAHQELYDGWLKAAKEAAAN